MSIKLLFSEYFEVENSVLDKYGALNICIDTDLPLYVDPFLLFSSKKPEYISLHKQVVDHLIILKELASNESNLNIKLFQFPEIKQNWLGDCKWGNNGRGLGPKFANNLINAFSGFYSNFGEEKLTKSAHIEKLTLVGDRIGRDFISDFTTNLILEYLLEYTQTFALNHLKDNQRSEFSVRCTFDKNLLTWIPKNFILPFLNDENKDFVLLTPIDILTKDESFICHSDLISQFKKIANALDNSSLRNSINSYFQNSLPNLPKKKDITIAIEATIKQYPEILDYYIQHKENTKENASKVSLDKIEILKNELLLPLSEFTQKIEKHSDFYKIKPDSYDAALQRSKYLKDVIENNDCYRIFNNNNTYASEETIQKIFRLTWFGTPFDVNSEVNNGRGPADYKISYGQRDSTIVEFKLGSSTSLKKNLLNQTEIYKKASKSINDIKVILCYTASEILKVKRILAGINQSNAENIIIIDATKKISASKV